MKKKNDVNSTKVIIFEDENGNGYKSLTYSKKDGLSLSQNIYNAFSKMDIIQEEIPKSVEQKKYNYLNFENIEKINNNKTEQIEKLEVEHNKIHENEKIKNIENNDKIITEQIEQLKKVEQNKNIPSPPPTEIINNVLSDDLKQDIIIKENIEIKNLSDEDKNIEIKSENNLHKNDIIIVDEKLKRSKEEKNISNKSFNILRDFKYIKSVPSLTKTNKKIYMSLSLFKKGNCLNEIEERRVQNKTHTKNNIHLNLNNFNYLNNSNNKINNNLDNNDKNDIVENNNKIITLSEIEVNNPGFIKSFKTFLNQEKIDIINDLPVPNNKNNILYLQQSNFWYLFVCYILNQNNNLSLYSIIHLLEQYNLWIQDKNEKIFYLIKNNIIEYIKMNYQKEIINQFLFMNKYKDINQIFEKFEFINGKKDKLYDYKQIKIDNINIINDDKNYHCKCDLCTNDRACFKKVYDLNKNNINVVNGAIISIDKPTPKEYQKICKDNMIKKINYNNLLHSNEAIFLEHCPYKNKNNYFSKSKTIIEEKTNIEHKYISTINHDKNIEINNSINNSKNNLDINIDNDNKNVNDNNNNTEANNNEIVNNINGAEKDVEIIEFNEKKKDFKNISKIKSNINDDKNNEKNDKIKSPENVKKEENIKGLIDTKKDNNSDNNKNKESIIEEKEEKDEESGDEDNKSNKKEKNNKRKKKKKYFTKIKKEIIQEKNENDEKVQEEKKDEEKSHKKKRKSGNSNFKKKNKSKNVEKEEKNELEEMLKEDKIENGKDDVENDNNSKRKKSKSPNKKKNKKY